MRSNPHMDGISLLLRDYTSHFIAICVWLSRHISTLAIYTRNRYFITNATQHSLMLTDAADGGLFEPTDEDVR